ncbi:hypothetical protein KEG38_52635 [Polyangium jinanense]|uniref:hypothetical protein n=1 Tax=Polyangium jinanense TaxID=2829994 RepID=UPI0023413B82|nr:hypothetical protein [Polyangium jinanense]MDC3962573.1 hypothetical protein [Polyangium jinanense]
MSEVGVYIPVSEVFPDVSNDFDTFKRLVGSLSRTDALFWSARLNLLLSNSLNTDEVGKQEYAIGLFFSDTEIERINRFVLKHGGARRVRVFMRAQLLEMIRWTCLLAHDHPNDGKAFEDPDMRRRYVQAALIAGDIWGRRTYDGRLVATGSPQADRRRAMHAIRSGIALNLIGVDLASALARGITIYGDSFRQSYKNAEQEFSKATGISLDQYLACACAITVVYANINPESAAANPGGFNINTIGAHVEPTMAGVLRKYLAAESQTADELRAALWGKREGSEVPELVPFDLKPLRDRPILHSADGRAIIVDPVFYSDKFSVGPVFAIAKVARTLNRDNSVFSAFGYAFESYVGSLLRTMYPPSASHLSDRIIFNPQTKTHNGNVEFADASLDDATDLVLFEIKGVFIKDETLQEDGIDGYISELRKKYGVTEGTAKDRGVKGIGQLARSVRLLSSSPADVDQRFRHATCIYSVLLVYDTLLSTPGHAEFFNREFTNLIQPEHEFSNGYMRKGRLAVAPIIIMTVEDLEILHSSIERLRLVDLLRDYCNTTQGGLRPSLSEFLKLSRHKYRLLQSSELAGRAIDMLVRTQTLLFPDANF